MALLHLSILFAIVFVWWKHKESRRTLRWIAIPFILLTLLNSPPAAYFLLGSLERQYPPTDVVPKKEEAIVVLAGLTYPIDRVRREAELGPNTLNRCLHAVALHRKSPECLLVVSGGPVDGDLPTAAETMANFLVIQGIKKSSILLEGHSMNTYENAVECYRRLNERSIHRIVLVTTASHMRRAAACFRKQGFEVIPAPCGHVENGYSLSWSDVLPDAKSAFEVDEACHEWLGEMIYRVRGRS